MRLLAYSYVGSREIRQRSLGTPGTPVTSPSELRVWLSAQPEAFSEGATYVVDLLGRLRLAPRRSEHVACADGEEVLAAGELRFRLDGGQPAVAEVSNLSTGYCPDVTCWAAVARALASLGLHLPTGFTGAMDFRRCLACGEVTLVKERWFVCAFCDADLPSDWNVSLARAVDVG
ncbi:hypothetical protein SAMN05443572_105587 [Myxococcus fulvus]|uniref:Uncharacterized protein n=1 Tax=Myxococcus fulvus TaxID=33 RepID=A0A511T736_MYXFU|nr:hypothetical protein MFU01_43690 [Myxococcus fulvus]SEU17399.1 hypothetical protein SAMN05443572_105587 [Myxococcus fulvus]